MVAAGLGAAYLGLDDGNLSPQEWVGVAQSALAALGVVWGIPNLSKGGKPTTPVETPELEIVPAKQEVTVKPVDAPASVVIDLDGK
jgi:hypothetical protein